MTANRLLRVACVLVATASFTSLAGAKPLANGASGLRSIGAGGQSGIASVYSGGRTANGERALPGRLTAAHRTLPFGTMVKVTHKGNGKSVVVRINDRGPFKKGRVIDLTPAAARALGFNGLAPVALQVAEHRS
jgi:rare lipoprotein A